MGVKYHIISLLATAVLAAQGSIHDLRVTVSGEDALPTESLQLFVRLDGSRARVILDALVRHNGGSRAEGTFRCTLPTKASPFLLAFGKEDEDTLSKEDTSNFLPYSDENQELTVDAMMELRNSKNSNVKAARMAGRALAARAYTETVNRNVDPAILEGGRGSFSTRVFPLFSGRLHRVVLGYDVPLLHTKDGLIFRIHIPAANRQEKLSPPIRVDVQSTYPIFLPNTPRASYTETAVDKDKNPTCVRFIRHDQREHLVALQLETKNTSFPELDAAPLSWGVVEDDEGDMHHFAASVRVPHGLPSDVTIKSSSRVLFAVETSFATFQRVGSLDRYVEIVTSVLRLDPDIKEFNVMLFDVGVQWFLPDAWATNNAINRTSVEGFLRTVLLEGATNLHLAVSELLDPSFAADGHERFDIFLISSGAVTWGESNPSRIVAQVGDNNLERVHTYHVGSTGGGPDILQQLARQTGGTFVGDIIETSPVEQSKVMRYLQPRLAVKSIKIDGSQDLAVSGNPKMLQGGQVLRLAWRSHSTEARTLRIEVANASSDPTITFHMPSKATDLAVRAYGIIASSILEEYLPFSEEETRSLALFYRIVGRTASLVMLETEDDYNRFGIGKTQNFTSVRSIGASQVAEHVAFKNAEIARSAHASFVSFIKELVAVNPSINLPKDAHSVILTTLTDSSVDIGSRLLSPRFDRTTANRSDSLRNELQTRNVPEASYDTWTFESNRRKDKSPFAALRALTSLLAQQPGDHVLRRDIALSAVELGFPAAAYFAFKQVAMTRPWEPMSYIQMARTAQTSELPDLAIAMYEIALAGVWDSRFLAFKKVAGMLYARHLRRINIGLTSSTQAQSFAAEREAEVRAWYGVEKHAGLVVVMTWNQDATDIDLHVTEPGGEECYFSNPNTKSGGFLSGDVTQGFGPEMYVQPNMEFGDYKVEANVFGVNTNRLSAPIKVLVEVFTDWGWSTENYEAFTAIGREQRERKFIATVELRQRSDRTKVAVSDKAPTTSTPNPDEVLWRQQHVAEVENEEMGAMHDHGGGTQAAWCMLMWGAVGVLSLALCLASSGNCDF